MNLDDIISKKEIFSIYSIMEEYSLDEKSAKKLCDEAFKDPRVTTYYMIICAQCNTVVRDGLLSEYPQDNVRCNSCRNSFKVKDKDIQYIYDPVSPLIRLKRAWYANRQL